MNIEKLFQDEVGVGHLPLLLSESGNDFIKNSTEAADVHISVMFLSASSIARE